MHHEQNSSQYYFLASPYNGSENEKKESFALSKKIVALFLEKHISIFSPILYNQSIIDFFPSIELENRRQLLMPMNIQFLRSSKAMILVKIPGWDTSWGLQEYFRVTKEENLKTYEISLETFDKDLNHLISIFHTQNM